MRRAMAMNRAFSKWAVKFRASPSKAYPEFGERAGVSNPRRMAITAVMTKSSTNVKAREWICACFGNAKAWDGCSFGVDTVGETDQAAYSAKTETWKDEMEIEARKLRIGRRR